MHRCLMTAFLLVHVACGGSLEKHSQEQAAHGTMHQKMALFYYSAIDTNDAQDPANSASFSISLAANETVMIGTCSVNESDHIDDTYLRLFNPINTEVASNDDACGLGSMFGYTATTAGIYTIRAGCLGNSSCEGIVAIARRKASYVVPTLVNTNNAKSNTYNKQYFFNGGETIRVSTCGASAFSAVATGDTFMRLFKQTSLGYTEEVASNDNAPGSCGTAAEISYVIPSAGFYQIRVGCAANTTCSATVAVYVE